MSIIIIPCVFIHPISEEDIILHPCNPYPIKYPSVSEVVVPVLNYNLAVFLVGIIIEDTKIGVIIR